MSERSFQMRGALVATAVVWLVVPAPAHAEFQQIDLTVFGMDCAPCAHGMMVSLRKIDGVESANVSLNEGKATIQLKPGNTVAVPALREVVKRNGFTPQQALVNARAEVIASGDRLQLKILGTSEMYELAGADDIRERLKKQTGRTVVVEGVIPPQKDPKATPVIQVNSVKPVTI